MGSSADFARIKADGTTEFTHISGDGYICGAGAMLFMHYRDDLALDALFGGDHIEELVDDPMKLTFMDDERDSSWPWNIDGAAYVFDDGAWYSRNFEKDDAPLEPLTRELIMADAHEYGSQDRVEQFLDGKVTLW